MNKKVDYELYHFSFLIADLNSDNAKRIMDVRIKTMPQIQTEIARIMKLMDGSVIFRRFANIANPMQRITIPDIPNMGSGYFTAKN